MKNTIAIVALLFSSVSLLAQENINTNKFRQLGQELPTPNVYRTASGAPGHEYYQQQVDYDMDIELDVGRHFGKIVFLKCSAESSGTEANESDPNMPDTWC